MTPQATATGCHVAAKWHPLAVAWGVTSLYLLAAVEVTSLLRARLGNRLWKRVHFLSFPLFVSATIHGLTAGTDSRQPMFLIAVALGLAGVGLLTAVRLQAASEPRRSLVPVS